MLFTTIFAAAASALLVVADDCEKECPEWYTSRMRNCANSNNTLPECDFSQACNTSSTLHQTALACAKCGSENNPGTQTAADIVALCKNMTMANGTMANGTATNTTNANSSTSATPSADAKDKSAGLRVGATGVVAAAAAAAVAALGFVLL